VEEIEEAKKKRDVEQLEANTKRLEQVKVCKCLFYSKPDFRSVSSPNLIKMMTFYFESAYAQSVDTNRTFWLEHYVSFSEPKSHTIICKESTQKNPRKRKIE